MPNDDEPQTETLCQDYGGGPGCLRVADERYTMRFDDIGEPPIHWCAHCGPIAHAMDEVLTAKLEEDPTFAGKLNEAIDKAKKLTPAH